MPIISFISAWLKDIVILFVLISIAELIMPKGNTRKYINLVIGLLIIFTIINPFARLLKMDIDLGEVAFNYNKPAEIYYNQDENFDMLQDKQIEQLYLSRVKADLKDLVERETEFSVKDLDLKFFKGDEYRKIESLTIYISKYEEEEVSGIYIEKVKPIDIKKDNHIEQPTQESYEEIGDLVHREYNIDKAKIEVIFLDNGKGGRNE
ncbi:MAG: stage III sporulation protein AF [Tissierellaceae bacterium]|nr:stage III sporulation protein AF [Tissierellaceae bacterium]